MNYLLRFGKKVFSNFYLGTSICFLVWVTFFDGNDLIALFGNHYELRQTETEIEFYKRKVELVVLEKEQINGTVDAQERFAREKYLMKKADEDVFLVENPSKASILDQWTGE